MNSAVSRTGAKGGRPRVDDRPGFYEDFCRVLPRLRAKEISQREAARRLGISVRSLKRYAERLESTATRVPHLPSPDH